ncbi:hypothetical protein HDU76_009458, partial [Blyttiomyces sp. JEL0837]
MPTRQESVRKEYIDRGISSGINKGVVDAKKPRDALERFHLTAAPATDLEEALAPLSHKVIKDARTIFESSCSSGSINRGFFGESKFCCGVCGCTIIEHKKNGDVLDVNMVDIKDLGLYAVEGKKCLKETGVYVNSVWYRLYGDAIKDEKVVICRFCKKNNMKKVGSTSLLRTVDLGTLAVRDLPRLSVVECAVIQMNRPIIHVIKMKAGRDLLGMKGHSLLFKASSNLKFVFDGNKTLPAWEDVKKTVNVVFIGKHQHFVRVFQQRVGRDQFIDSMSDKFSVNAGKVELWLKFLREYGPVEYRRVKFDLDKLQEKLNNLVEDVLKETEFIGSETCGGKMEEFLEGDALGGNGMNEGGKIDNMPVFVDIGNEEEVEAIEDVLNAAKDALGSAIDSLNNTHLEVELGNESDLIGFVDDHAEQVALAFPWLFPLGLDSSKLKFDEEDMKWLLNQYDQRIALCSG